jgi:hypothetical protein
MPAPHSVQNRAGPAAIASDCTSIMHTPRSSVAKAAEPCSDAYAAPLSCVGRRMLRRLSWGPPQAQRAGSRTK